VLADVTRDMRVIREETFGPILTVERFRTEEEAIALGNDTEYGLAGAVWTADPGPRAPRGRGAAPRHGVDQRLPPLRPRGGVGRDEEVGATAGAGPTGLAEYQEHKHIWHNTAPAPMRWFRGEESPRRPEHVAENPEQAP
jgi:betaine-aldehyde dehydrogenase